MAVAMRTAQGMLVSISLMPLFVVQSSVVFLKRACFISSFAKDICRRCWCVQGAWPAPGMCVGCLGPCVECYAWWCTEYSQEKLQKCLNAIQFSKTNVLYDIVSMRQNNIQEDRSWTADRYLYDSSDYVTLWYDPPWSEIYLHRSQKADLIGSNEVAAMSGLFKGKCCDFVADVCRTEGGLMNRFLTLKNVDLLLSRF